MCVCTYGSGVLFLLVKSGAALLLAVAVLLQRVEDLIGQLQIHPQPVTHVNLWSELQRQDRVVTMETAALLIHHRSNFLSRFKPVGSERAEADMLVCFKCLAASVWRDAVLRCPYEPCSCGHRSPRHVWL